MDRESFDLSDFIRAFSAIERASFESQISKPYFDSFSKETLDLFKSSWISALSLEIDLLDTADFLRANQIDQVWAAKELSGLGAEADFIIEMLKSHDGVFPF